MPEPSRAELKYQVERQREEIKTVNDVGRLLSSTTDPQEIVRLVASYLRQTFPLALCGVLLTDSQKLHLIRFANIAQVDFAAAVREMCAKASERLSKPVRESMLTHIVEDQSAGSGRWVQGSIGYLRSNHFAPLILNGQAIGQLGVFSGKAEGFSPEDRHVIDIVADQLGAALRNTSLLEELRRANQLKNDLLMVISHELRIPLTSIKEGVNLVLEQSLGPVTTEQRDFLKTVNDNAARLEALVEKVLTATQLLTGQLTYTFSDTDLAALLNELEAAFQPLARVKDVTLERSGLTQPFRYSADRKRLAEALANLIENALQATPAGGRVTILGVDSPEALELEIRDTGTGIPPEELPRLFEQFRIIGGTGDRKTGGLGLGLFIAKAVLTAHGGTIQLDSQVGQGTRVKIRLPLKKA